MRLLLFDLGIHGFDLLRVLSGAPLTVEAAFPSLNRAGMVSQVLVVVREPHGRAHSLRLCMGNGIVDIVTIVGEDGLLQADRLSHSPVILRRRKHWRVDAAVRAVTFIASSVRGLSRAAGRTFDPSYGRALGSFLETARRGTAMTPTPDDALAAAELAEQALVLGTKLKNPAELHE